MVTPASPCRAYIVYHHWLFARGLRSILETRRAVQIVGMESDVTRALTAVQSLNPEVIIVEESARRHQPMRLGAFLHSATGGRVVSLSLDHAFATVYQRNRMTTTDPGDLVKAVLGSNKRRFARPDQPHPTTLRLFQPETQRHGDKERIGRKSRGRRARRQGTQVSDTLPRTSRGSRKGG
jgi:hypothetical protein